MVVNRFLNHKEITAVYLYQEVYDVIRNVKSRNVTCLSIILRSNYGAILKYFKCFKIESYLKGVSVRYLVGKIISKV